MVMIDHIFSAEEEAGNIYFLLTPVALAFFVACDGSYDITNREIEHKFVYFSRSSTITVHFIGKFGIESTTNVANKTKDQYTIRIAKGSMPAFQTLVAPHIPPMMAYRAGL